MLGFATGVLCVWLTARAHIWNFPVGILSSTVLGLVFLQQRLFDAALQIVFIVLSARGWVQWLRPPQAQHTAAFAFTSLREQCAAGGSGDHAAAVASLAVAQGCSPAGGCAAHRAEPVRPVAAEPAANLGWAWWIAVDLVAIPLYWSRGLPLIAGLSLVFLRICLRGWWNWRTHMPTPPLMAGAAA